MYLYKTNINKINSFVYLEFVKCINATLNLIFHLKSIIFNWLTLQLVLILAPNMFSMKLLFGRTWKPRPFIHWIATSCYKVLSFTKSLLVRIFQYEYYTNKLKPRKI